MESDDFTRHYIIRYLSARELVLPHHCFSRFLGPISSSKVHFSLSRYLWCLSDVCECVVCLHFAAQQLVYSSWESVLCV